MSSEQVIAAVLSEVLADHGEGLSVGAFDEIVDRLSTPAASKSQAKRIAIEQGYGNRAPFAIVNGEEFAGPQDLCFAYSQLQARNAEQAADLKEWREAAQQGARVAERCLERLKAKDAKLTALLAGIEGLEKDLLGADWLTDSTEIAHDLKALREKANVSQGVVPSPRPGPGKCIK